MMIAGSPSTGGLLPATIPWDDITNDSWENRADNPGDPWYYFDLNSGGFWGFDNNWWTTRWTYQMGYPTKPPR